MKTKHTAVVLWCSFLIVLLGAAGCQRGRTDPQIASDIQSKIGADMRLANKPVTVQVKDGVVTLSGRVDSEAEKNIVQNYAAAVDGVKSVTNNLEIPAQTAALPAAETAAPPAAEPAPKAEAPKHAKAAPPAHKAAATPAAAPAQGAAPASAPAAAAAPAAPFEERVTIPAGTDVSIRMIDSVDTSRNQPGDKFRATVDRPIMLGEQVIVPRGADVEGKVVDLESAGRFKGRSELTLVLTKLTAGGKSYELKTDPLQREGASRGKRTAEVVGGGGALGAIIGGIAGGGKGAAIGAGAGAGAGAGVQAVTKGQQVRLPSESVVDFRLSAPLTVTKTSTAGRQR